ncbi:N-acetyllactosaminide beta-1,3-N-acetylglucosaminyltransferase 2 isoform X3 [Struthio camelus]|uniref:N-acetyllactosaminide beta-1,3-N-acetylglucosaminyltransferase 2 isoform X3 n=1 Tax=Struthio camelus TaxID=8801 RepID=UPI003603AD65
MKLEEAFYGGKDGPFRIQKKSFENNSQAPNALPLLRSALPQLAQIHVLCCWEEGWNKLDPKFIHLLRKECIHSLLH